MADGYLASTRNNQKLMILLQMARYRRYYCRLRYHHRDSGVHRQLYMLRLPMLQGLLWMLQLLLPLGEAPQQSAQVLR